MANIVAITGLDVEVVPATGTRRGARARPGGLHDHVARPEDMAEAVHFAVTSPAAMHVQELVVRPNKDLALS